MRTFKKYLKLHITKQRIEERLEICHKISLQRKLTIGEEFFLITSIKISHESCLILKENCQETNSTHLDHLSCMIPFEQCLYGNIYYPKKKLKYHIIHR